MTTPPDDEHSSPGGPNAPSPPGNSAAPDSPSAPALARLLDRRSSTDGAHTDAILRALVDASPLAMWVLDPDAHVLLWNRAAERLTGWPADEVLGRPNPMVPS